MWAFTGRCHYTNECLNYLKGCGNCPVLFSNSLNDLSKKIFKRKQKTYNKINMTIIGLSKWLNETSKNSQLLRDKKHINLPNPINTETYKQFDKDLSRELWNLPKNKKLILFGAMSAISDNRKGFEELSLALEKILNANSIELVIVGSSQPKNPPDFGFKSHYLGILNDDVSLATLYSAVILRLCIVSKKIYQM